MASMLVRVAGRLLRVHLVRTWIDARTRPSRPLSPWVA